MVGASRQERTRLSKRLSYHLRHRPEALGIALDRGGWVALDDLVAALGGGGRAVTRAAIEEVVRTSGKQRFELSADGRRIRARYGHSVPVDLGHRPATPPDILYHGTAASRVDTILTEGLRPMGRRQVHLSADIATARQVGARHGTPVVLTVDAGAMAADGYTLVPATDAVWLVDEVPARYLRR